MCIDMHIDMHNDMSILDQHGREDGIVEGYLMQIYCVIA